MSEPVSGVEPERSPLRRAGLPLAIIAGLLLVTVLTAGWLVRESRERADRTESDAAAQAMARIQTEAAAQRSSLLVLAASLAAVEDPDSLPDFQELATPPLMSGIQQVGWLPVVPASERSAVEARLGTPLRRPGTARPVPAPDRPVHYPLAASAQPQDTSLEPLGLDHAALPERRAAIQQATQNGQTRAAGPTDIAPETQAMITYVPVFGRTGDPGTPPERRAAVRGFVSGTVTLQHLTEIARGGAPQDADVAVSFAREGAGNSASGAVAGVPLTVAVSGLGASLTVPLIVLLSGLGVAALVGMLFLLAAAREREGRRSEEMVREERDRSQAVVSAMQDGLLVLGEGLAIESTNARLSEIVGIDEEALIGMKPPFSFLSPDDSGRLEDILEEVGVLGVGEFELTFHNASGASVPVILSIAKRVDPARRTAGYVSTVKDITSRKRAERSLRERDAENRALAAQQTALRTVATAVAKELDPDAVFKLVAREAQKLTVGDVGGVARFAGNPRSGVVVAWSSEHDTIVPSRLALADGVEAPDSPLRATILGSRRTDDPVEAIAAPVRAGSDLWGVVFAEAPAADGVTHHAEGGIEGLAELASLAIANDDARRRLESAASTDPLTGLANRRTFDERLRHEVARALRAGQPLSLVLADIDHFKAVNDTHGHQAGDQVLVEVAARLISLARVGDLVARVGGEELAWILTETDSEGALAAAERARLAIRDRRFSSAGSLTISLGVATATDHADADRLVGQADAALYWAKQHGRDQSRLYTPEIGADPSQRGRRTGIARAQAQEGLRSLVRGIEEETDPGAIPRSDRVAQIAAAIADALGWSAADGARLREAAMLHDVGWVAVPTRLRVRKGELTPAEMRRVRLHAEASANMAGEVLDEDQAGWIRHHHERWDGEGYPDGLEGEEIPVGARILALADAWVAMTSPREYRPRLTDDQALAECRQQSGRQFWPRAVRVLEAILNDRAERLATLGGDDG